MTSSSNLTNNDKLFRRLALLTVIIIYLLILVGGIVRSTGSGMGCPDWPKCFGQWVPPTDVSQLPANYQELYGHRGYADTTFNVAKTWTEYLNRLLGVFTGFFIFLTFIISLRYIKRDVVITILSFLGLLLVGVQGWLGSVVVKTVLTPWIVTLHMLLAIVIVGVLLYVVARTYAPLMATAAVANKQRINWLLIGSTALLLIQVLLGTQVREQIDHVAGQLGEAARDNWIDATGLSFLIHRSFSLLVLASQLAWVLPLRKNSSAWLQSLSTWVIILIVAEIITGAIMGYFAIPKWAQPVHLTLAVVALGIQFVVWLLLNKEQLLANASSGNVTARQSIELT